jgi:hypothetical protein
MRHKNKNKNKKPPTRFASFIAGRRNFVAKTDRIAMMH